MKIKKDIYQTIIFNDAYKIRKKVFVEEQNIPIENEIDEYDSGSLHYVCYENNIPVGTARAFSNAQGIKIGRVATLKEYRKKGIASKIINQIIVDNKEKKIYLYAQMNAYSTYLKLNFKPYGEKFFEENIEHIAMEYVVGKDGN